MREIKFRGLHNGEWNFGNLKLSSAGKITYAYIHGKSLFPSSVQDEYWSVEVEFDSVGQFTGLKDKNKVDIYEGDICYAYTKHWQNPEGLIVKIIYNSDLCRFEPAQKWPNGVFKSLFSQFEKYDFEVIGNIHQNPELL